MPDPVAELTFDLLGCAVDVEIAPPCLAPVLQDAAPILTRAVWGAGVRGEDEASFVEIRAAKEQPSLADDRDSWCCLWHWGIVAGGLLLAKHRRSLVGSLRLRKHVHGSSTANRTENGGNLLVQPSWMLLSRHEFPDSAQCPLRHQRQDLQGLLTFPVGEMVRPIACLSWRRGLRCGPLPRPARKATLKKLNLRVSRR